MAYLDAHPEVALVNCYSATINASGRCLGWRLGGRARGMMYPAIVECDIVAGGSVPLVRKAALLAVGGFNEQLEIRSDWDLWIRLARKSRFGTVPRTLVGYTRSPASLSRVYDRMAKGGAAILEGVRRDDPAFGDRRYRYCLARDTFAVACFCFIDGNIAAARAYLRKSLAITPAPIVGSPRRWGVVLALLLSSALPPPVFRGMFGVASRVVFGLRPGQLFTSLNGTESN